MNGWNAVGSMVSASHTKPQFDITFWTEHRLCVGPSCSTCSTSDWRIVTGERYMFRRFGTIFILMTSAVFILNMTDNSNTFRRNRIANTRHNPNDGWLFCNAEYIFGWSQANDALPQIKYQRARMRFSYV